MEDSMGEVGGPRQLKSSLAFHAHDPRGLFTAHELGAAPDRLPQHGCVPSTRDQVDPRSLHV